MEDGVQVSERVVSAKLFRFKELSKVTLPFFRLEGIELNFRGYEKMMHEYQAVDANNLVQAFEVTKALMLWVDYFEELRCVIRTCRMKLMNRETYLEAFVTEKKNVKLDNMIVDTRNNRKMCEFYEKELYSQIKFMNFAYKHISGEYNNNILQRY